MQTVETLNEGLKRAYTLKITAKDIDSRVDAEVKRVAPQIRMPGFRPGKVPANLVRKMHGEALTQDALNTTIQEGVQKLIADHKLRPAMQPAVSLEGEFAPGSDAEVKVELEVLPEAVTESATEALRAGNIVRRLREFVARGEVEKRVESLPQMVEEATRLAMTGARERGVRGLKDLDPDARLALVDRVQIQQVLVNLVRNAVEALEDAPVRDVTIATRVQGDGMIRVEVSDTGPGIDPAIRPRLFDAFNTSKPDGLGLGLSICRTIIEAHGGRIDADPRPGGGTTLWFTIPSAETQE